MEFLNVTQAAKILGINKFTLYRWSESGKIPSRRIGTKLLRFCIEDIEAFTQPALIKPAEGATTNGTDSKYI